MQALKQHIGIKLISGFVIALSGLALLELTVVSIFASTNNIQIPVTDTHIALPAVLSLLGLADHQGTHRVPDHQGTYMVTPHLSTVN